MKNITENQKRWLVIIEVTFYLFYLFIILTSLYVVIFCNPPSGYECLVFYFFCFSRENWFDKVSFVKQGKTDVAKTDYGLDN